jgi:hypothetical protein
VVLDHDYKEDRPIESVCGAINSRSCLGAVPFLIVALSKPFVLGFLLGCPTETRVLQSQRQPTRGDSPAPLQNLTEEVSYSEFIGQTVNDSRQEVNFQNLTEEANTLNSQQQPTRGDSPAPFQNLTEEVSYSEYIEQLVYNRRQEANLQNLTEEVNTLDSQQQPTRGDSPVPLQNHTEEVR